MSQPFDLQDAEVFLAQRGEAPYRAKQLFEAIFALQIRSFDELTTFPAPLRAALTERYGVPNPLTVETVLHAAAGDAHKAALRTHDGHLIESVLLRVKAPLWTVCVSSQVGCAMACRFCATGTMGLTRNLTTMEICWQVLHWIRFLREQDRGERLTNVVYMGMGEPLANLRAVAESLHLLTRGTGMRAGRFAVSTSGIVPMIDRFPDVVPKGVKLAISIHAGDAETRSSIVPVNDRFPLKDLIAASKRYIDRTGEKIFFEYVVLKGVNDRDIDAKNLGRILRPLGKAHLNLINMNPVLGIPYDATDEATLERFRELIRAEKIEVTIRRDHGQDIMGACGQLVTIGKKGIVGGVKNAG